MGPHKMRVLLAVAALFVAGASAGGKEYQEMKMWMKMKAMEGCLGEDVMKAYMKKMMKAFMQMQMLSQLMDDDSPRSFVKRDADDEFDLGSKLQEKLAMKKEHWEAQYGNITCMLRECDILDSKDKFNPEGIKKEGTKWAKMLKSEWLSTEMTKWCDLCVELAEAVPKSMQDACPWGGEMVKVKTYMKCMMKHKVKICMNYDIKQKLEQHFGSVEKLEDETNIPAEQLFMLVREMLKGPEVDMMMNMV